MPTNEELIPTKAELLAARNAANGAVWSVLYGGLALTGFAHRVGDPEKSNWQFDKFGIEAEQTFRRMIERRDALDELIPDRLMTAVEEAKARAGDPMPVSVGNLQFPTYHRAAMIRLRRFVMMLSIGRPFNWPSWVYELERDRPGRPANDAERHAYYKSLLEDLMSFPLGSNVEEMETGIRCECAHALAAAPDAEDAQATRADTIDGAPEDAPPALTVTERLVVATLARFDGSQLLPAAAIALETTGTHTPLSARTIGPIVLGLIQLNLAERPKGNRSGVRLTTDGRRLAQKIAD